MNATRQLQFHCIYLNCANEFAKLSYAKKAQVGAVIVKDKNIIAFGYNGTPESFDNCCEYQIDDAMRTKQEVLHAESNAIAKLAKNAGVGSEGSVLYCTYSPCFNCAKLIIQSGIVQVIFQKTYETDSGAGVALLRQAGIKVLQIKNPTAFKTGLVETSEVLTT